jgi:hypothetical protein
MGLRGIQGEVSKRSINNCSAATSSVLASQFPMQAVRALPERDGRHHIASDVKSSGRS